MSFFLIFIIITAFLQAIVQLSLMKRKISLALTVFYASVIFFFNKQAAQVNINAFNQWLENYATLNSACTIVIIQALVLLFLGISLLRRRHLGLKVSVFHYLALMPSLLFPVGAFIGMVFVFNHFSGTDFKGNALLYSGGLGLLMFGGAELNRAFAGSEDSKVLQLAAFHLSMITLAMFIPVVAGSQKMEISEATSFNYMSLFLIPIAALLMLPGFLLKRYLDGKNISSLDELFFRKIKFYSKKD